MGHSARQMASISTGSLLVLFLVRYSSAVPCTDCDVIVSSFFTNLTRENAFGRSSSEYGNQTCGAANDVLNCYNGCIRQDGTESIGFSYLHSKGISKEAYTMNEWWRANCDDACRMADTLVCEHFTYQNSLQCNDINQWRSCVSDALAPYSCEGFCQVSDRWHHAYKLHHELDCANASQECLTQVKTCLRQYLAFEQSPEEDISYLLSWEFFYNGGLPREFKCDRTYRPAETCFNVTGECQGNDHIRRLKTMLNNAYGDFCSNDTDTAEAACTGSDVTTASTSTFEPTSTISSSSTSSSSTSSSTTTPVTIASAEPGTCQFCDRQAELILDIASLHKHSDMNLREFGDIVCRNYSQAMDCYNNCTSRGEVKELGEYFSEEIETLHTQIVLSCDASCRHADLWICENYLTTADWCMEGDYERWLSCYENGTAQYNCDNACGIAQRRVNTYKLARQVACSARKIAYNVECVTAVNECINVRFSRTDLNFEKFLTVNIESPKACGYFMSGSQCLTGQIPVFRNDSRTIDAFCTNQTEINALAEIDGYWKDLYHHEECASIPEDSSTTYADICLQNATSGLTIPTTAATTAVIEDGQCVDYVDGSASNPCRANEPFQCDQRNDWLTCVARHSASSNCTGLCSANERVNAMNIIVSSAHCNLPAGLAGDLCSDIVQWNCIASIWTEASEVSFDVFIEPKEPLNTWCGKVEKMKSCLHNATYGIVPYFGSNQAQPCGSREEYMNRLIELVNQMSSSTCSASSWQEACPGSELGLDGPESQGPPPSEVDECPENIKDTEVCPAHHLNQCGQHFQNWTACLAEEQVFTRCNTLCTRKTRRAYATYTEHFLSCTINKENNFCWEYISNECLNDLFGDSRYSRFVNMHHNRTVQPLCELMESFAICLSKSKTENVTLTSLDTVIQAPCGSQTQVIDETMRSIAGVLSNGLCRDSSRHYSDVCSVYDTTGPSIPQPTTQSVTRTQASSTTQRSTTVVDNTQPSARVYKVSGKLTLDADYNTVVVGKEDEVKEELKEGIAGSTGVTKDKVEITSLAPGSIKVEFVIETENMDVATSSADSINSGLPAMTVGGQTYNSTSEVIEIQDQPATTTVETEFVTDPIFETTTDGLYFDCLICVDQMKTLTQYKTVNSSLTRDAYAKKVCHELNDLTEVCFANCIKEDGEKMGKDHPYYSQARTLKSFWCQPECGFANMASCFARKPNCDSIKAGTFESCLEGGNSHQCSGICTKEQRYVEAERLNHYLDCFPGDSDCKSAVKECFGSLSENSMETSAMNFAKFVVGDQMSSEKKISDVCQFLSQPANCLNNLDLTSVCQNHVEDVQNIVSLWKDNIEDDFCQGSDGNELFGKTCQEFKSRPPTKTTPEKPVLGPKSKAVGTSSGSQLYANQFLTMLFVAVIKLTFDLL